MWSKHVLGLALVVFAEGDEIAEVFLSGGEIQGLVLADGF